MSSCYVLSGAALIKKKGNIKPTDSLMEFSSRRSPQKGAYRNLATAVVTCYDVTYYAFKDGGSQCQVVCCETQLVILTVTVCEICLDIKLGVFINNIIAVLFTCHNVSG